MMEATDQEAKVPMFIDTFGPAARNVLDLIVASDMKVTATFPGINDPDEKTRRECLMHGFQTGMTFTFHEFDRTTCEMLVQFTRDYGINDLTDDLGNDWRLFNPEITMSWSSTYRSAPDKALFELKFYARVNELARSIVDYVGKDKVLRMVRSAEDKAANERRLEMDRVQGRVAKIVDMHRHNMRVNGYAIVSKEDLHVFGNIPDGRHEVYRNNKAFTLRVDPSMRATVTRTK